MAFCDPFLQNLTKKVMYTEDKPQMENKSMKIYLKFEYRLQGRCSIFYLN